MNFDHEGNITLYHYHPDHQEARGYFIEDSPDTIYINDRCGKCEREFVYWHESQHRRCFKSKCTCWTKGTDFWCEYHAFRYSFQRVQTSFSVTLKRMYLKAIMGSVKRYTECPTLYPTHLKALNKLMNTKAFKKFAKGIKNA